MYTKLFLCLFLFSSTYKASELLAPESELAGSTRRVSFSAIAPLILEPSRHTPSSPTHLPFGGNHTEEEDPLGGAARSGPIEESSSFNSQRRSSSETTLSPDHEMIEVRTSVRAAPDPLSSSALRLRSEDTFALEIGSPTQQDDREPKESDCRKVSIKILQLLGYAAGTVAMFWAQSTIQNAVTPNTVTIVVNWVLPNGSVINLGNATEVLSN